MAKRVPDRKGGPEFKRLSAREFTEFDYPWKDGSIPPLAGKVVRFSIRASTRAEANEMAAAAEREARSFGAYAVGEPRVVVTGEGAGKKPVSPEEYMLSRLGEQTDEGLVKLYMEKFKAPERLTPERAIAMLDMEDGGAGRNLNMSQFERILSVKAKDVMLFGDIDVEIPDAPVVLLSGMNWSGKSTFAEVAVPYAWFGEVRAGNANDVVRWGAGSKSCVATERVRLVDGRVITIERGRDESGGLLLNYWDCCDPSDAVPSAVGANAEPVIAGLAGRGVKDCLATMFTRADEVDAFSKADPAERYEMLARWYGLERWAERRKKVREKMAALKEDIARAEGLSEDAAADMLREAREALTLAQADVKKEETTLAARRKAVEAARGAVDISALEAQAEKLRDDIAGWGEYTALVDMVDGIDGAELRRRMDGMAAKADKCGEVVRDLYADLQKSRERVASLEKRRTGGFDGKCPVDHADCPRKGEINGNSEALNAEIAKAAEAVGIASLKSKDAAAAEKSAKAALDLARMAVGDHERREADVKKLAQRYSKFDAEQAGCTLEGVEKRITDASAAAGRLKDAERDVRATEAALGFAQRVAGKCEEMIAQRSESLVRVREQKLMTESNRALLADLAYVEQMSSPAGIPTVVLENRVGEIESRANSMLEDMGVDFRVAFAFRTDTAKKASVCACGYEWPKGGRAKICPSCNAERGMAQRAAPVVNMVVGGEERRFDAHSKGGRSLMGVCLRLAAARAAGMRIAVLDEVLDSLDAGNRARFVRLLENVDRIGLTQIFVISHFDDVKDAVPAEIHFTAGPNGSTAEVV